MSETNDRALRFYHEVLGLSRLHYGLWDDGAVLNFDNLRHAQENYENMLVDNLPQQARRILDVGCGTGVLAKKLLASGYQVEGLSPDINQQRIFTQDIGAPFHHMPFEQFTASDEYDCIIMSESCQYIALDKVFENARRALVSQGHLMICDYFVFDHARGELAKSGHAYTAFMQAIEDYGFDIRIDEDITERTLPTLDLAKDLVDRALLALDIATEKPRQRHPLLSRLVMRLLRKKIDKAQQQRQLLDADAFRQNKTYRFLLLQSGR